MAKHDIKITITTGNNLMVNFRKEYNKIKDYAPRRRGFLFERLFYKIFNNDEILLERSFKNDDGSQQIDGAIEINNRIFIVEIKWEQSETLAASKLYSFLGKINSKIDGTLGLFISYNELSKNFLDSVRGGIKQNCIIIHGEENILPIIGGEISVRNYVWYIYQQASTRNRITVSANEFKSLPKKSKSNDSEKYWDKVYKALISDEDPGKFELKLNKNYGKISDLPEKTVILYPIIKDKSQNKSKIDYLIDTITGIEEDKLAFHNALVAKLNSSHWIRYADEYILNKAKKLSAIDKEMAAQIADRAIPYLRENEGQWEEENKASLILDFVYHYLSEKYKKSLANEYAAIYCDRGRRDHFPQKRFAEKVFDDIDPEDRWDAIKDEVGSFMTEYKDEESILTRKGPKEIKKYVFDRVKRKFERIINESNPKNLDIQIDRIYNRV